jgi:branched-subunit amino acid transport protein
MSATEIWLAVIGMTLVTTATRAFFLLGGERAALRTRGGARRRRAA